MELDSTSIPQRAAGFSSDQLNKVDRFFDHIEKRIVTMNDHDRLAEMNPLLAELDRKSGQFSIWARYQYLQKILIDVTHFTRPGVLAAVPPEQIQHKLEDSPAMQRHYAFLHYSTMQRIVDRSAAALSDRHRAYFDTKALVQADAIISLAPEHHRVEWLLRAVAQTPYLSQGAIDRLISQAAERQSPTGKESWRARLQYRKLHSLRRVKSP